MDAAFEPDFDFDALFAADDLPPEEPAAKVRVSPRRIAVALSVTLAALPLLLLDNFQATASTPSKVDASQQHDAVAPTGPPAVQDDVASTGAPSTTALPLPQAVVFQANPTTTSTDAPTTTTTAAPTTTTTSAKPRVALASAPATVVTTTTTTPPTTAAAAPATSRHPDPNAESTWDTLAKCESNGNWGADTGNGYYGGLQFSLATWHSLGGEGYPNQASKSTQIAMGKKLYARSGWDAWPGCQRKLGWS